MTGTTILVHLADQRRARTDSHGIINFSLGLTRALPAAAAPDERLVVLVNDELLAELGRTFLREGDALEVVPAPRSIARRLWVDHVTVVRRARRLGADVVLYPKGFLPLTTAFAGGVAHVPCFHDDIPARARRDRQAPWRRRLRAGYFTALLRHSMRAADRRLFVSGFSARQLAALAGGARPDDVVVHEGITLPPRPLRPLAERAARAVVLGSHHPHKRVAAGLRLIAGDPAIRAAVDRVVVVGPVPAAGEVPAGLDIEHVPGPLEGEELADLVAGSRVLVYPSCYEGFGLPPVEAYALGTPAIFRATDAAMEVLDGVPGCYADEEPAAFAAAAATVLALDDEALGQLSRAMWARYDWAVVADAVATAWRGVHPSSARTGRGQA